MNLFSFLLLFFLSFSVLAEHKIMVLHSYDAENVEEKTQRDYFIKNLYVQHKVDVEHLNVMRVNYDNNYKKMFYEYLKAKYNSKDLIFFTTNEEAFYFTQEFFHDNMKISLGVYEKEKKDDRTTIVSDDKNLMEVIKLINSIDKDFQSVAFISDSGSSLRKVNDFIDISKNKINNFISIYDFNLEKIIFDLKNKNPDFVVLVDVDNIKLNNKLITSDEVIFLLKKEGFVNIVVLKQKYINNEVVGGVVLNNELLGKESARIINDFVNDYDFSSQDNEEKKEGLSVVYINKSIKLKNKDIFSYPVKIIKEEIKKTEYSFFNFFLMFFLLMFILINIVFFIKQKRRKSKNDINQEVMENVNISIAKTYDFVHSFEENKTYWNASFKEDFMFLKNDNFFNLLDDSFNETKDFKCFVEYQGQENNKTYFEHKIIYKEQVFYFFSCFIKDLIGSQKVIKGIIQNISVLKHGEKVINKTKEVSLINNVPSISLVEHSILRAKRKKEAFCLMQLKINSLLGVNVFSNNGISFVSVYELLKALVKDVIIQQIAEDEFLLIYENIDEENVSNIIKVLLNELSSSYYMLLDKKYNISLNIGAVFYPKNGLSVVELLKNCEYALKESLVSKNNFSLFSKEETESVLDSIYLNKKLLLSIQDKKDFKMKYSPIYKIKDLNDFDICAIEPKLEWVDENYGIVANNIFYDLIKKIEITYDIDSFLLKESLLLLKELKYSSNIDVNDLMLFCKIASLNNEKDLYKVLDFLKQDSLRFKNIVLEVSEVDFKNIVLFEEILLNFNIEFCLCDVDFTSFNVDIINKLKIKKIKLKENLFKNPKNLEKIQNILKIINSLGIEVYVSNISNVKEFEFYFFNNVNLMQGDFFDNVITAENLIEKICNVY